MNVQQIIEQAAAERGVSPEVLLTIAALESNFDPNAKNPRSSAGGLFQFIDSTAGDYGLSGASRYDPALASAAAAELVQDNAGPLTQILGREPTVGEYYLAHQQGLGGASALLRNPNANVVDALAPIYGGNRAKAAEAVRLNGGNVNMSAGEFGGLWVNKANQRASLLPPGYVGNGGVVASQLDTTPAFKKPGLALPTSQVERPRGQSYAKQDGQSKKASAFLPQIGPTGGPSLNSSAKSVSMPTPADQRPGAVRPSQPKNTGLDPVQSFIASFFAPTTKDDTPAKREMVKSDRPQSYAGQERAGKGEFNPVTAYKPLSAYENQRSPWVPMPLAYPEGKPAPQAKRPISYAAQDAAKPRVPSSALIPKGEMVYTGSRDAKPYAANSGNWAAILAAANQIKAQQAQRQQPAQAPRSNSGGSSGGSSDPYEPPRVSFSGVSTGRTYTEGQKYSMGGDTYVANANGSFTNTRTGKTLVGSSQQRSDEPRSSNSPAQSLVG